MSMKSNNNAKAVSTKLILVAASSKPESIDPSFRRGGRLDVEIEIGVPTAKARRQIMYKILEEMKMQEPRYSELTDSDINSISDAAHGYVGADLQSLCSHAQSILTSAQIPQDNESLGKPIAKIILYSYTGTKTTKYNIL